MLRVHAGLTHETKHRHPTLRVHATGNTITGLFGALGKIDGSAIQARRCAGLQPPLWQLQFFQARRQANGWGIARTTRRVVLQAHMDLAVQKRAGGQHHRARTEADAHLRDSAHHPVALHHQVIHSLLKQPQIGLVLQHAADGGLVQNPVGLGTGSAHGRTFGGIQDSELDSAFVSGQRHGAAHRVHLFDQMALANAADAGVTAHLAQRFDVVSQKQSFATHPGGGQGSLGSGMAAADHDHIEFLRVKHESLPWEGQKMGAACAMEPPLPRGRLKLLILQAGCFR